VLEAEAARSTAAAAEARAHALLAGSRREDVQLAHAQADAAEARRDQARAALDRLTVRAPISGEVLQVLVRAGEYSQLGSGPLVVIGDLSELRVRMDVDETKILEAVVRLDPTTRLVVGQRVTCYVRGS
jgi:HlyD family secretion protein